MDLLFFKTIAYPSSRLLYIYLNRFSRDICKSSSLFAGTCICRWICHKIMVYLKVSLLLSVKGFVISPVKNTLNAKSKETRQSPKRQDKVQRDKTNLEQIKR